MDVDNFVHFTNKDERQGSISAQIGSMDARIHVNKRNSSFPEDTHSTNCKGSDSYLVAENPTRKPLVRIDFNELDAVLSSLRLEEQVVGK